MKLTISENIRRLRTERGLTQEQLAEAVGISAQAVSRWENGSSYPDITLLPTIADLFSISTDALLGADTAKKQAEIRNALDKNSELHHEGRYEDSIKLMREKLKRFPDSAEITYQLAWALNKKANALAEGAERDTVCMEIIDLCERAARLDRPSSWITHGCRQMLCLSNLKLGQREKAREIAESMPTWWISREYLVLYTMDVEEAAEQRQHNLLSLMDMMILHLHKIARDMKTDRESAEVLDKACTLADMITGGDHKFYDERIFKCVLWKAGYLCRSGDTDAAFEALEKALFHAERYESRPERSEYDAFWLWRIKDVRADSAKDLPETLYQYMQRMLSGPMFERLHGEERFIDICAKLEFLVNS